MQELPVTLALDASSLIIVFAVILFNNVRFSIYKHDLFVLFLLLGHNLLFQ